LLVHLFGQFQGEVGSGTALGGPGSAEGATEKPGSALLGRGEVPEGTRLDDGSDLSAKTKRIIYARWPLLETNFAKSAFYSLE
jgi:hypothetical protein